MSSQNQILFLKRCQLLGHLSDFQLADLEKASRMKQFPAKATVDWPGGPTAIYLVANGLVRIGNLTRDGKLSTLAYIEPGEIFGELGLFSTAPSNEFVETCVPSTLVRMPYDAIRQLADEDVTVMFEISRLLGFRQLRLERRLKCLLYASNFERLIYLLLELGQHYGEPDSRGIRIRLRLTHEELASLIGSTREAVSIGLSKLRKKGIVDYSRTELAILKPQQLQSLVGEEHNDEVTKL